MHNKVSSQSNMMTVETGRCLSTCDGDGDADDADADDADDDGGGDELV